MSTSQYLKAEIEASVQTHAKLLEDPALLATLGKVTEACIHTFKNGGKTIFAGNGASAADAQHLSAAFVSRFYFDRPSLPSLSLSSDPSVVTALGNDYGFENLFARQIQSLGKKGDVFFALSTSGKSPNILKAIAAAKELGLTTVALTSSKGADLAKVCEFTLVIPSSSNPRIQEAHITIGHALCAAVEQALFKK